MLTVETLSPAEMQMIKVKREQEALAKKEAETKKALQLEKDIKMKEDLILRILKKDAEQNRAADVYLSELGSKYSKEVQTFEERLHIYGDYTNPENPRDNGYEREVLWSKTITRKTTSIKREAYRIRVSEQTVYNRYGSGSSKGHKMYVDGPGIDYKQSNRAYARATTVNEIIDVAIEKLETVKKYNEAKKNAVAAAMQRVNEEFPDATVTSARKWASGYKGAGYEYDAITVTFKNNIQVIYRVHPGGEIARESISFPESDAWKLMATLNQMNF